MPRRNDNTFVTEIMKWCVVDHDCGGDECPYDALTDPKARPGDCLDCKGIGGGYTDYDAWARCELCRGTGRS